jgi:hypothetical protein
MTRLYRRMDAPPEPSRLERLMFCTHPSLGDALRQAEQFAGSRGIDLPGPVVEGRGQAN